MIKLTHSRLTELLEYAPDTGKFTWKIDRNSYVRKGDVAGTFDTKGYIQIRVDDTAYLAHRLAWMYVHGSWPTIQIDHTNRNRSDNRLANLRLSTQALNNQNASKRRDNKSGITGVWRNKRLAKWQAYICVDNKQIHLGVFDSFDAAVQARTLAVQKHHTFRLGD